MTLDRCPGCRARLAAAPICPRCGCDLTLVVRAAVQARRLLCRALRAWADDDRAAASACAVASLALDDSLLGRAVRHFVGSTAPVSGLALAGEPSVAEPTWPNPATDSL